MDFDILDRKIRRLVAKLKKYNVDLEVFEPEDIELHDTVLGKGGEGIIQSCTIFYNGLPVDAAAKRLLDNSDTAVNITLDEIELLCLSRDPVIQRTLHVYGIAAIPDDNDAELGQLVILMEEGVMSALQFYQESEIPLHVTFDLMSQVASAVHMLHTKKILHHDLKPDNILIKSIVRDAIGLVEKLDVKIIDLGMGRRVFTDKIMTDDILGTNGYHPPEVLFEPAYDFRADVFMLGLTFCILLMPSAFLKHNLADLLKELHDAKKNKVLGRALYDTHLEPHIENVQNISPIVKSMLCMMLERQSKRVISLVEVVEVCRDEAVKVKERQESLPPVLSPAVKGEDSGFSSENSSRRHMPDRTKKRGSREGSLSSRRSSRSSSFRSSADSCSLSSFPDLRKRRRNPSTSSEVNVLPQPRKRVRRACTYNVFSYNT